MPDLVPTNIDATSVERVLLGGDLAALTPQQRVTYYGKTCESLGLNPLTRPFEYITLNNRLVLYARRECTDQLRKVHVVSITITAREMPLEDMYAVTARATLPDGRTDESIGVKSLVGLKGDARANAMMTAETKAKRRVTLAICGLGLLDETEINDLPPGATAPPAPAAKPREIDPATITGSLAREIPPATITGDPVTVVNVEKGKTSNPKVTKYTITLSTGETATTVNEWLASLAQELKDSGRLVIASTRSHPKGTDLLALQPADPEPPPAGPLPF